jgi:hypothetical protein
MVPNIADLRYLAEIFELAEIFHYFPIDIFDWSWFLPSFKLNSTPLD